LIFTQGPNIVIPTGETASVDNYAIGTNFSYYTMTGSNIADITGFASGVNGRYIIVVNNSTSNQTFRQESTSSTASNRFVLGVASITINPNNSITFIYSTNLTIGGNSNQSRWIMLSFT
jgi:hypothetical protein